MTTESHDDREGRPLLGLGLGEGLGPIEALRFFCSEHLPAQAWLDVEPLFDAVIADRADAVAAADREWFGKLDAADAEVARLTAAVNRITEAYDAYRRRGVNPAPAEYGDVVAAIEAARGPNVE